ncbi:Lamin-like protein [Hordeum vulgare]|nr:Lamin-like protein [Hordeum vulgare]
MDRRQRAVAALLLAAALAACAATPATAEHKIYINWLSHNNYSDWARSHGPFYKGDYLGTYAQGLHVFVYRDFSGRFASCHRAHAVFYTPEKLDVVEVNERGFDRCDPRNPIYRFSGGREIAILLGEAKVYYFICSVGGYCPDGMRLAIEVHDMPRTPASALDDTFGAAVVESRDTSPAPGPRASSEGESEGQARGSYDYVRLLGRMSKIRRHGVKLWSRTAPQARWAAARPVN